MLLGKTEARLFTPPLRTLTPETSKGFEVIEFAEKAGYKLLPWQAWLLKAMLELNEDGTYRFRRVLIIVGRQSGKSTLMIVLAAWILQAESNATVLGVAQDLSIARQAWNGVADIYEDSLLLDRIRKSTGDLEISMKNRSRYRISASNGKAGRGMSVRLLLLDELREMKSWDPYQALAPTTTAQRDGMIVGISNAGEHDSVVLNGLRQVALDGTEGVGLFEWSAVDGCELDDPEAWSMANPGLGYTVQESELRVALATFPPEKMRIEHLCQQVRIINTAVDLEAWNASTDDTGSLSSLRDKIALCLDVSPDLKHVTLVGAGQRTDGRVRLQVFGAWDSTTSALEALPGLLERLSPTVLGWFPGGPAAALAADLRGIKKTQEIKSGDVAAICQGFTEAVASRRVVHPGSPLLNAHIGMAIKSRGGRDGWVFVRPDADAGKHVDALYSAAGALHLARTAAPSVGKPRIIVAA